MLSELSIENFAVIDRLHLRFERGFTVLTGETGAGKSIIIDALQASLGARVSADVVRVGASLASVEAVFELGAGERTEAISSIMSEYGLDDEGCLILRREFSSGGRSTARMNGRAVPSSAVSAVGALLVDIHGQSEHLSILRRDKQLEVLDRFGGLLPLRTEVGAAVTELNDLRVSLEQLSSGRRDAAQRLDLLRFQVQEIDSAGVRRGEDEELGAERNLLANAEKLTQLASAVVNSLHGDGAAIEAVGGSLTSMHELATIDASLVSLEERLNAAYIELEDVAQEVRRYRDQGEFDPRRLDSIEERLDQLARLRRKYGDTLDDVVAFRERAHAELEDVENLDDRVADLAARVAEGESRAAELCEQLSRARHEAAAALAGGMRDALQGLGLKGTSFQVGLEREERSDGLPLPDGGRYKYSLSGVDAVSFMVSFNAGEPLRPIERVASGGETSRFLLALKSVLADADGTPTLIFDEVDVGVGRSGGAVGERLRHLARGHQVISITHLPQVAALADNHLTVTKGTSTDRTVIEVRPLEKQGRILELAEMMTGTGTEVARRNAAELLDAAQRNR